MEPSIEFAPPPAPLEAPAMPAFPITEAPVAATASYEPQQTVPVDASLKPMPITIETSPENQDNQAVEAVIASAQTAMVETARQVVYAEAHLDPEVIAKAEARVADIVSRAGSALPTRGDVMKTIARANREMYGNMRENN